MCLVALLFQTCADAPLVVGANREEAYARGGLPPRLLDGELRAIGGVDPTAGGTWLGVNERGVLIAVTNRSKSPAPKVPRSRGLLARDLLSCERARAAADHATRELGGGDYAGCNVVCADGQDAVVLHANERLRVQPLPPGLHLLTAQDVNDLTDARQEFARAWLRSQPHRTAAEAVPALRELCGLSGDAPMCLRSGTRGTVSSAVFALTRPLDQSVYLHAQGPPDVTPYEDYSGLLKSILVPDRLRD
jgi:uncharacterized protein with NRDE domain